jgi:hypothetical protein
MKKYILAQKFYQDEEVTIDSADQEMIKTASNKCEIFNNTVIGQVLEYFTNAKEDKKSTPTA